VRPYAPDHRYGVSDSPRNPPDFLYRDGTNRHDSHDGHGATGCNRAWCAF